MNAIALYEHALDAVENDLRRKLADTARTLGDESGRILPNTAAIRASLRHLEERCLAFDMSRAAVKAAKAGWSEAQLLRDALATETAALTEAAAHASELHTEVETWRSRADTFESALVERGMNVSDLADGEQS